VSKATGALIVLARESRGYTQAWLADAVGISQSKLSKYEVDAIEASENDLDRLSEVLGYTREFFSEPAEVYGANCFYHRKQASMPSRQLRAIHAQMNVFRMQVKRLLKDVTVEQTARFEELDVDKFGGPANVAREMRKVWSMPEGPVRNLTALVERAGAIVWKCDFGTRQLDAIGQAPPGEFPLIFVNSASPGDRLRFSIAHEVGHALMHWKASADRELEANQFASEFLMPLDDIGVSLRNLSLDRLALLKQQWKTSMQAIIKKAGDSGKISERHVRTLFTQMSKNGWRTKEPVECPPEEPTVIAAALAVHSGSHGLGVPSLADRVFLRDCDEFRATFMPRATGVLSVFAG
jgi:Zn-dependent peptidase ImmA (M78 family)/transcriptional regulator with XRE-family HTH domain